MTKMREPANPLLPHNLHAFLRSLRRLGLPVGPAEQALALRALAAVGWETPEVTASAVCAVVATRPEHVPLFREAWRQFLLRLRRQDSHAWVLERTLSTSVARLRQTRHRHPQIFWMTGPEGATGDAAKEHASDGTLRLQTGASRSAAWKAADFAKLTEAERREAVRFSERVPRFWTGSRRYRLCPAGAVPDLAATLREAARKDTWLPLQMRRAQRAQRAAVWVVDVSGSMEPYSRMVLSFVHSLQLARVPLELFAVSTQLTRATATLRTSNPDRALAELAARTPDFAGGTRFADALAALSRDWARTVMRGDPVLLLVTDGFDSGDPALLADALARLRHRSRRVVWLNPAAADASYAPTAQAARVLAATVDDAYPAFSWSGLVHAWRETSVRQRTRPVRPDDRR
ncbi:MAG: VWA domain-containing protein [Alicyclobacillus sp.]|nr:VWA domain-containing protein [Alicyclobacillus sp.]